jgi:hypothetical protein
LEALRVQTTKDLIVDGRIKIKTDLRKQLGKWDWINLAEKDRWWAHMDSTINFLVT